MLCHGRNECQGRSWRFLRPKNRLNPQLAMLLDPTAQVLAQEFSKHFVDHRGIRLAPNVVPEFLSASPSNTATRRFLAHRRRIFGRSWRAPSTASSGWGLRWGSRKTSPTTPVTGKPAWHQLGTVIAEAATSAEAIHLAGLNWTVEQQPVYLGSGKRIPDRLANVRGDTGAVLGVVSTGYQVFQNEDCFDFMDALVADRLAKFETAGALREGRQIWMLARIPSAPPAATSSTPTCL